MAFARAGLLAKTAYVGVVVAAASLLVWGAVGAHEHPPKASKKSKAAAKATLDAASSPPSTAGAATAAHELSCDLKTHKQLLGALPAASGLALSRRTPDVLWSMDDSEDPVVVPLSTSGVPKGRVRVTGAAVSDWEDVSVGPCASGSCLYVADIGESNREKKRTSVTVYRVPEPKADDAATAKADALEFNYPKGHSDAEALFVAPDATLFIITKGHPTILYRAPRAAKPGVASTLEHVAELPIDSFLIDHDEKRSRVTDAETSPDGTWVILRTNVELLLYRTRDLIVGKSDDVWHADLHSLDETQGEGVAMSDAGDVYLAGEGGGHHLPGTFAHISCQLPK